MRGSRFALAAEAMTLLLIFIGFATPGLADSLYTDDRVIHGKVSALDSKKVVIRRGCSGPEEAFGWDVAKEVIFNDLCDSPSVRLPSAGGGVCASKPVVRFLIYFRNLDAPLRVDGVTLTPDGTFHYDDQAKLKQGHGPAAQVRGIARRSVCPDDEAQLAPPAEYCVENKQFAVNFSYDAPLGNKVLTRGVSFFLETVPSSPERHDELRKLVRDGFAAALNFWLSDLWRRRGNYDPILLTFLEGLVSRSPSGYQMITAPQVVALECPHAATFIVRVYVDRAGPFSPRQGGLKAAFAAKPGRTLLLNFADYPCWKQAYLQFVLEKASRCLNVVAVLMHELGHAFGLGHVADVESIMNETIYVSKPSGPDLDRLAAQLVQSIQGPKPGAIDFVEDNGVAVE